MKNTADRIRIIKIFKKFARFGLASNGLDPIRVYGRILGCSRTKREARELIAVYETVNFLEISGKGECLDALYGIYFALSSKAVRKSEVSERILRYASDNYCDERTVYRRLSYVVRVYERYLGL